LIDESEELDVILEDGGERRGESECDIRSEQKTTLYFVWNSQQ
jgi:hypothetical protein